MLRNLFFYPVLVIATLVMGTLAALFGRSFGDRGGTFAQRGWSRLVLWAAGVRLEVDTTTLDPDQTYVFMANHQSNLDIPILTTALNSWTVRMVAKESLFRIPVFGPAIRRTGHVAIDRSNPRSAIRSIERAVAASASGISMVVFPEGTRHPDPEPEALQDFQIGGFVLALKTGLPVAPVIIEGSGHLQPKGAAGVRGGTARVTALAPIAPGHYTLKQRELFKSELQQMMNDAYKEHRHGR